MKELKEYITKHQISEKLISEKLTITKDSNISEYGDNNIIIEAILKFLFGDKQEDEVTINLISNWVNDNDVEFINFILTDRTLNKLMTNKEVNEFEEKYKGYLKILTDRDIYLKTFDQPLGKVTNSILTKKEYKIWATPPMLVYYITQQGTGSHIYIKKYNRL